MHILNGYDHNAAWLRTMLTKHINAGRIDAADKTRVAITLAENNADTLRVREAVRVVSARRRAASLGLAVTS